MIENKRFLIDDAGELIDLNNHKFIDYGDECCNLLNELHDENKELYKVIEENEKIIQSIYEELTKLRHIKENLRKIKNQWNHLIESICYD